MSEYLPVLAAADLPPGSAREVVVSNRIVALFNVDGVIHALDGICPHAGGPLGEGRLQGCILTCPWHGWQFDVTTGQHCLTPHIRQTLFPVRVENGQIQVSLGKS